VKQKSNQVNLVLGDDVKMHQVVSLSTQALVGRFHGRSICEKYLKKWLQVKWEPYIGNVPVFYLLTKGWMESDGIYFGLRWMQILNGH
jgi:hypothetical protein